MAKLIVIDGPAKSGKGTVAGRAAKELGFTPIDSGNHYRAVAAIMIETGLNPLVIARRLCPLDLKRSDLRSPEVEVMVSQLAKRADLREAINHQLRWMVDGMPGAMMDGRAGAQEFPEADVRIYLTSSVEVRAKRFYDYLVENQKIGERTSEQILEAMRLRDEEDFNREVAPLVRHPTLDVYHYVIDSSAHTSVDETVAEVVASCKAWL